MTPDQQTMVLTEPPFFQCCFHQFSYSTGRPGMRIAEERTLTYNFLEEMGVLPPPAVFPRLLPIVDSALVSLQSPFAGSHSSHMRQAGTPAPLCRGERLRLRAILEAIADAPCTAATSTIFVLTSLRRSRHDPHRRRVHPFLNRTAAFDPRDGFWRVDQDKDPELRHTVLALVALHDLEAKIKEAGDDRDKGIEVFLNQNHGEGWLLPETLRLADYGLGHDDRARHPQPVASRLGPRFYDWQLAQTPEESHRECHLHARNFLGEHRYRQLLDDIQHREEARKPEKADLLRAAEPDSQYGTVAPKDLKPGKLF